MTLGINELAEQIAALDPVEQEKLLQKVAELNFHRGLEKLSQKYQERLALEGKLAQKADQILTDLAAVRAKITDTRDLLSLLQ